MNPADVFKESAQYIKGVGPKRYSVLNRLGIYTIGDLLYYFPRRYEDRSSFSPIAQLRSGEHACVKAKVSRMGFWRSKKGLTVFELTVHDSSGTLKVLWFNQPFMKRYFKVGQELIFYGKAEKAHQMQMNVPEFELVSGTDSELHMGRIVPLYPLTASLNQRYLRTLVYRALEKYCTYVPDILEYTLRDKLQLLPLTLALRTIHFPDGFAQKDQAYRRLVFEEFFYCK